MVRGRRYAPPVARAPVEPAELATFHSSLSNWGRWGPDDQLGALNLITPDVTAAAAALVRTGRRVSCARPLDTAASPDNSSPVLHHMTGTATEGYGADYLALSPHGFATSHLDALCHIFHDGHLYNGYPTETVTAHGAAKLGIHHLRDGIVTRGVLLDIPALLGQEALEPGTPIFPDELEAAERAAGVTVRSGDLLLVRTGRWYWRATHGPWAASALLAGLDASCLPWLRARDVAALGSDGVSDVLPSRVPGVELPVHTVALVAMGLHLLDNLDLETLARTSADEGRWEFLLTVAPLILRRGTASPVNPIALF
jgi:kynurenine formamidase